MKERPIIFSGESVRAVLSGRKTQTRRVVKPQSTHTKPAPVGWAHPWMYRADGAWHAFACPYGVVGNRLWVRESFRLRADQDHKPPSQDWWKAGAWYPATDPHSEPSGCGGGSGKLRPSIHMPRWASRITLELTGVRVERVQEMNEQDAIAEGVSFTRLDGNGETASYENGGYLDAADAWDRHNAKRGHSWESNPWVWVLEFRRVEVGA